MTFTSPEYNSAIKIKQVTDLLKNTTITNTTNITNFTAILIKLKDVMLGNLISNLWCLLLSCIPGIHFCAIHACVMWCRFCSFRRPPQSHANPQVEKMAVCSLVIDKVQIRANGVTKMKIGRIIIGFEDADSGSVSFDNKYIHYSPEDYVHNEFCYNYNGIDRNTISKQGERYAVVIDWARAAIRGKSVVVCGTADVAEVVGETPCRIVNLQDFFFNEKDGGIVEPISLSRLCSKVFAYETHSEGRRDPFQECRFKIALFHVMNGFKAGNRYPPFGDSFFPKVQKGFFSSPPKQKDQGTETTANVCWEEKDDCVSHHKTMQNVASGSNAVESLTETIQYVNLASHDDSDSDSWSADDPDLKRRSSNREPDECGRGSRLPGRGMSPFHLYEELIRDDTRLSTETGLKILSKNAKSTTRRFSKKFHAFIACAVDTSDHL